MTRHYNPNISNRALRILNSKGTDTLSDNVTGPVAVIPITPTIGVIKNGTGSATIYTVPTGKIAYLWGGCISFAKDITATGTLIQLAVVKGGVTMGVAQLVGITLTAERDSIAIPLPFSIKLSAGDTVLQNSTGTFTAARVTAWLTEEEITT